MNNLICKSFIKEYSGMYTGYQVSQSEQSDVIAKIIWGPWIKVSHYFICLTHIKLWGTLLCGSIDEQAMPCTVTYHESFMKPSHSKSPQSTQNGLMAATRLATDGFTEMMENSFTRLEASLWWPLHYIISPSGGGGGGGGIIAGFLFWITGSW